MDWYEYDEGVNGTDAPREPVLDAEHGAACSTDSLPDEMWSAILQLLDARGLLQVASTCHRMNGLVNDDPQWRLRLARDRAEADDEPWMAEGGDPPGVPPKDIYFCRLLVRYGLAPDGRIVPGKRMRAAGRLVLRTSEKGTLLECGARTSAGLQGYGVRARVGEGEGGIPLSTHFYRGMFDRNRAHGHGTTTCWWIGSDCLRKELMFGTYDALRKAIRHLLEWAGSSARSAYGVPVQYEGSWHEGTMHGRGTLRVCNPSDGWWIVYDGEWADGLFHERGSLYIERGALAPLSAHPLFDTRPPWGPRRTPHREEERRKRRPLQRLLLESVSVGDPSWRERLFCGRMQWGALHKGTVWSLDGYTFEIQAAPADARDDRRAPSRAYDVTVTTPTRDTLAGRWDAEGNGRAFACDATGADVAFMFHRYTRPCTANKDALGRVWDRCVRGCPEYRLVRSAAADDAQHERRIVYPNGDAVVCRWKGPTLVSVLSFTVSRGCPDRRFAGVTFDKRGWTFKAVGRSAFDHTHEEWIFWPYRRDDPQRAEFAAYVRSGLGPWSPAALALYESVL
jgi:hypothetical protein